MVTARVHPVHWWMQTERRVAANPQTKPTNLGCESTDKWLLPSTSTIAICYYYSAKSWYSFYRQPRHCRHWCIADTGRQSNNEILKISAVENSSTLHKAHSEDRLPNWTKYYACTHNQTNWVQHSEQSANRTHVCLSPDIAPTAGFMSVKTVWPNRTPQS